MFAAHSSPLFLRVPSWSKLYHGDRRTAEVADGVVADLVALHRLEYPQHGEELLRALMSAISAFRSESYQACTFRAGLTFAKWTWSRMLNVIGPAVGFLRRYRTTRNGWLGTAM